MKRFLLATTFASAMALTGTAWAQMPFDLSQPAVGKAANTFMIRVRAIGVIPEDNSSSVTVLTGGHVNTTAQPAPEVDFSYFLTDHIAAELIAATTRHSIAENGSAVIPGKVDVGSTWVLPPTLTLQYHFFPQSQFSPYIGAGVNVSFFYDTKPAGPLITHVSMNNGWGPAVQAGVDYNFAGHWFANFDVKQIFLNTGAHINAGPGGALALKAKTSLDPLVIGAGIGYRF